MSLSNSTIRREPFSQEGIDSGSSHFVSGAGDFSLKSESPPNPLAQIQNIIDAYFAKYPKQKPAILNGESSPLSIVETFQRMVDSLELQNKQLEVEHAQAEKAANGKDLFLASMSHEIRTQLNGMVGIMELMIGDQNFPESQRNSLTTMKRSSGTLQRILNDILDYTQLCAYEVKIESHRFSPAKLVEDVIGAFKNNAETKELSLFFMIAETVPEFVTGDETRLRQILSNLLNNSIKFTENGRVGVFLASETSIGGQIELQFEVLDTGIGMSKEQIGRLFQPFSQADASTSRKFGGSGLGLLICKNLVERMGGTIEVESEEGNGSAFQFSITVQQNDNRSRIFLPGSVPIFPRHAETASPPLRKGKVLLAEDNDVNQLVGKMTLERLGYQVDVADDGNQAIDAARKNDYDLICMDVTMPDMDGLEATRRIRKLGNATSQAKIIAMTGHAFAEDRKLCLDAGMDGFLSKPFEISQLKEIIERTSHLPKIPENQELAHQVA